MTMATTLRKTKFVVCIEDREYDDLEKGKIYAVLPDSSAKQSGYIRVVDESGEDYLYPESCFVPLELPDKARAALGAKS